MTSPTRRSPGIFLATALYVLAAGCDGGRDRDPGAPEVPVESAGDREPADFRAAPGNEASTAAADSVGGGRGAPATPALEVAGEMELADGRVERAYRVRLVNDAQERLAAVAEIIAVPPGVEVLRGRLELGDVAAGAAVSPVGSVTLRHAENLSLQAGDLQWRWRAGALTEAHRAGQLLAGRRDALAVGVLRSLPLVEWVEGARPARLAGMLSDQATVAQVNDALREASLHIVEMRPGNHGLTLATASGDERDLQRAAQRLQASPAFVRVHLVPGSAAAPPAGGWAGASGSGVEPLPADVAADAACES